MYFPMFSHLSAELNRSSPVVVVLKDKEFDSSGFDKIHYFSNQKSDFQFNEYRPLYIDEKSKLFPSITQYPKATKPPSHMNIQQIQVREYGTLKAKVPLLSYYEDYLL
jgi:hypothetical protein